MEISKISNSPNFQAKYVIGDERIQKFIKSSFLSNSKDTFETLDKFSVIHPDSVVLINIKRINGHDHLVAKNGINGEMVSKYLHDTRSVKLEDHNVFIDLIKKIMTNKSFWD